MKPQCQGRRSQYALLLTVAAYSASYMAQVPLLPYLLQEIGHGNSSAYGRLSTVFSTAQVMGGLLAGPFVDKFGGRALMLLSLVSSVASYALTASATSMTTLYISRIFTLMQHAILAARTCIAATTTPDNRARSLGLLGMAYGAGFALGPALGGVLSRYAGLRATAWVATGVSAVSMVVVWAMVPAAHITDTAAEDNTMNGASEPAKTAQSDKTDKADKTGKGDKTSDTQKGTQQGAGKGSKGGSLQGLLQPLKVLQYPAVRQLLSVKLATGLASALQQSVFTLMLQRDYGLSSQHNGLVLSFVGAVTMASQAGLVEPARRRLGDGGAVQASCVLLCVSYGSLVLGRGQVLALLATLVPMAVGASVLSTVNTAQLTRASPPDVTGSVLSLDMTLFSAVRILTPAIGTALLDRGGAPLVGAVAAAMVLVLLVAGRLGWVRYDGGLPPIPQKQTETDTQATKKKAE